MSTHSMNVRIYYEDTDAGGIVYHANYLKFAERARTEFLRDLGYSNSMLAKEKRILYVVRHASTEYYKPAFLDDFLRMDTHIETIKNTSFVMTHKLFRPDEKNNEELLAEMRIVLVCIDSKALKPVRFPEEMKADFEKYLA